MPKISETYDEFVKRHSTPDDPPIDDGHSLHLRFFDGASANLDETHVRTEPSPSEPLRLMAMIRYRMLRRDRAEKKFAAARSTYSEQCLNAFKFSNLPVPDQLALNHLNQLRDEYATQSQKLAELQELYDATDFAIDQRRRDEDRRRQQAEIARIHEQINNMTLYDGEVRKTTLEQAAEDLHAECDRIATDRIVKRTGLPREEVAPFVKNNRVTLRKM